MRLVTFSDAKGARVGVHDTESNTIVDLSASTRLPKEMTAFVALGKKGLSRARKAVKSGEGRLPLSAVKLLAPFPRPAKNILCVGKNYHDHAKEFHNSGFDASAGANAIPDVPIMFTKWPNSVIGPGDAIPSANDYTNSVDYEGELTVVMGEGGRNIGEADALRRVAGYCVANDVSERQWQLQRGGSWDKGKGHDSFAPIGPWLVTADAVPDPQALDLWLDLDGTPRQRGNTRTMVFGVRALVAYISQFMRLEPGDLIFTGTPPGVGMGHKPPLYLRAGQLMTLGISGLGTQTQRTAAAV